MELQNVPLRGRLGLRTRARSQGAQGCQALTIDLMEAQRKPFVWQATAEGSISDEARKNLSPTIDAIVTRSMAGVSAQDQ